MPAQHMRGRSAPCPWGPAYPQTRSPSVRCSLVRSFERAGFLRFGGFASWGYVPPSVSGSVSGSVSSSVSVFGSVIATSLPVLVTSLGPGRPLRTPVHPSPGGPGEILGRVQQSRTGGRDD
jgi:hypothetical protein